MIICHSLCYNRLINRKGGEIIAHYYYKTGLVINLTGEKITTYTPDGAFITLYPKELKQVVNSDVICLIPASRYNIMKEKGFKDNQLARAREKGIGRDGVEVATIVTFEKRPIRIMPTGEL